MNKDLGPSAAILSARVHQTEITNVNKKPIRIVKKEERCRARKMANAAPTIIPTEQETARTMTKTVTGWIREFKDKSGAETGKLLAVFEKLPRPNEA